MLTDLAEIDVRKVIKINGKTLMMKKLEVIFSLLLVFISAQVSALTPVEIEKRLRTARADLPAMKIIDSEMPGIYEITMAGGSTLYASKDGKYFISGDLYQIANNGFVNVKEVRLKPQRKIAIDAIDEKEMLVYSPPKDKVKATITVFTDIDCGYCRKLHQEVPELNRLGIAVRYLAYPRAGIHSESYNKAVSAWCADNPTEALTRAKSGQTIPTKTCDNPVAKHYSLGGDIGVTGTPAVIYEDGTLQPGYVPAKELAGRLGIL